MIRDHDQAVGLRLVGRAPAKVTKLRPSGRAPGTHVLAVTSGKGGVGKTQIAANVAVGLAQEGAKVLMLDADLGLASLDLALGVTPKHDLLSVLQGRRHLDEILVTGPEGVCLIPACPGRYDVANLDASQRARLWDLVEEIAADFDVLVIDTGAGIGSNAVGFASYADDVLLVTTPDPTALRDAYAMAKVLHRRSGVDRIRLIANQVASEREGLEIHARIDGIVRRFLTLSLDYLGAVPRDAAVADAVRAGRPFVVDAPLSAAGRALSTLSRRLRALPSKEAHPC